MIKFKKDFNVRVILLLVAVLFLFNSIVYGIDISTKSHLRPPLGKAYEDMLVAMQSRNQGHQVSIDARIGALVKQYKDKNRVISLSNPLKAKPSKLQEKFNAIKNNDVFRQMFERLNSVLTGAGGEIQVIFVDSEDDLPIFDGKRVWGHAGTFITVFALEGEDKTRAGRKKIIGRIFHEIRARSTRAEEIFNEEKPQSKKAAKNLRKKFEAKNIAIEKEVAKEGTIKTLGLLQEFQALQFTPRVSIINRDYTSEGKQVGDGDWAKVSYDSQLWSALLKAMRGFIGSSIASDKVFKLLALTTDRRVEYHSKDPEVPEDLNHSYVIGKLDIDALKRIGITIEKPMYLGIKSFRGELWLCIFPKLFYKNSIMTVENNGDIIPGWGLEGDLFRYLVDGTDYRITGSPPPVSGGSGDYTLSIDETKIFLKRQNGPFPFVIMYGTKQIGFIKCDILDGNRLFLSLVAIERPYKGHDIGLLSLHLLRNIFPSPDFTFVGAKKGFLYHLVKDKGIDLGRVEFVNNGSPNKVYEYISDGEPHTKKDIAGALSLAVSTIEPDLYFLRDCGLLDIGKEGREKTYAIKSKLKGKKTLIAKIQQKLDEEFNDRMITKNLRIPENRERIAAEILAMTIPKILTKEHIAGEIASAESEDLWKTQVDELMVIVGNPSLPPKTRIRAAEKLLRIYPKSRRDDIYNFLGHDWMYRNLTENEREDFRSWLAKQDFLDKSTVMLGSAGSGFVIAEDKSYYYIMTNTHCVWFKYVMPVIVHKGMEKHRIIGHVICEQKQTGLTTETDIAIIAVEKSELEKNNIMLSPVKLVNAAEEEELRGKYASIASGYYHVVKPAAVVFWEKESILDFTAAPSDFHVNGDSGSSVVIKTDRGPVVIGILAFNGVRSLLQREMKRLLEEIHKAFPIEPYSEESEDLSDKQLVPVDRIFTTQEPDLLKKALEAIEKNLGKTTHENLEATQTSI